MQLALWFEEAWAVVFAARIASSVQEAAGVACSREMQAKCHALTFIRRTLRYGDNAGYGDICTCIYRKIVPVVRLGWLAPTRQLCVEVSKYYMAVH